MCAGYGNGSIEYLSICVVVRYSARADGETRCAGTAGIKRKSIGSAGALKRDAIDRTITIQSNRILAIGAAAVENNGSAGRRTRGHTIGAPIVGRAPAAARTATIPRLRSQQAHADAQQQAKSNKPTGLSQSPGSSWFSSLKMHG